MTLHYVYSRRRPDRFIGPLTGAVAVVMWNGATAGVISLMALKTGAPLIDESLARADAALGVATPDFVDWVAHQPAIARLLELAYLSSLPLLFATVFFLIWRQRVDRVWELCFVYAGTITVCTLFSTFAPAVGAFVHYGTSVGTLAMLPEGAGIYHMPIFETYRTGATSTVDFTRLQGVVTFPSFHTCMALMLAHALRGVRWISGANYAWNGLVVVSTVPIGGHYVVDLIAAGVVWGAFAACAQYGKQLPHTNSSLSTAPAGA